MKTLSKTIWFKAISILLVGIFAFQTNAYALKYNHFDVLPDYDWKKDAIGFAVTVGMPFVPGIGAGLGTALSLSQAGTIILTTGIGAGIGATPGLVSGDSTSALIGGALGGFSGYSGINARFEAANQINMAAELARPENWQANVLFQNAAGLAEGGYITQAAGQFQNVATAAGGTATELGRYIGDLSNTFATGITTLNNTVTITPQAMPALGQLKSLSANTLISGGYAGEPAALAFNNAHTFAEAGRLSDSAHQLSLVPDLANATISSGNYVPTLITPSSVNYLNVVSNTISPSMQQIASNLTIAITTQQVGSTLAEIATLSWGWNPESAQFLGMVGASTVGTTMGAMTPGGQKMMSGMYKELHPGWAKAFAPDGAKGLSASELKTLQWKQLEVGAITGLGLGSIQAGINIGIDSALDGKVPDSARFRLASLGSEALGAIAWGGIAGGLGENAVKAEKLKLAQELAKPNTLLPALVSTSTSEHQHHEHQHRASAPAPSISTRTEHQHQIGVWEGIKSVAGDEQFQKSLIQQGMSIGISWAAEHNEMEPQYASILGSSGSMLLANMKIWPGGRLREPTAITPNEDLDAILEPGIYGALSLAMANLSKDKTGTDLIRHNLATMHASALAHAGLATVLNKQGWEELKQGYRYKIDAEFYPNLLSFGTEAYGAPESAAGRRPEEMVGRSNIYGAAQRNDQLWNFAGLGNFAYADRIRKQGGDWRLQMALNLPSSPFAAMADQAGSMARYYTIRNLEGLSYTGIKSVAPYDLARLDKDLVLVKNLAAHNPEGLHVINEKIKQSLYPARVQLQPEDGRLQKFIYFPGFKVGFDDQFEPIFENTVVGKGIKYKGTEAFRRLNVNRPFELPQGSVYVPASEPTIAPPSKAKIVAGLKSVRVKGWEDVVKGIENEQIRPLEERLRSDPENPELKRLLEDAYGVLDYTQQELRRAQEEMLGSIGGATFDGGLGGKFRGKGFTGNW